MRCLVVDDNRTSRRALEASIRVATGGSAEVVEASNLDEAMAAFDAKKPDVVFLDMMLDLQTTGEPGGSTGLVALDLMLRSRPDARVVLVTALGAEDLDVQDALKLGAFAHLGKPVQTEDVRRIFRTIVA